jgi:cytochrome c551/c552
MALKDISAEDKVKIALDAIIGEVFGKSSSEVAQKYPGVSTRAVTALKNQALGAIQDTFSGNGQAPASAAVSDEEISAGINRLLGSNSSSFEESDDEDEEQDEVEVSQIVEAMMKYNDRAAKENKQRIYISRTIAQELAPHSVKEADEFFKANKKAIDDHNNKHNLKRNTNRALKGQKWQRWIEL